METSDSFEAVISVATRRLQRAFVARYGVELGNDALADTLVWAWEHRDQLAGMDNPTGYLYRVGQTSVRSQTRRRRRRPDLPVEESTESIPMSEPALHAALSALTDDQRAAVLLVHAHGYSYAEAAATLDIPITTLRNHIHRGMKHLRRHLET